MRPCWLVIALAALCSCGVEVEVATDPLSVDIPETSVGVTVDAEVALDIPPQALGDIVVEEVSATMEVVNTSKASPMQVEVRLSKQGTAQPGSPIVYPHATRPTYVDSATLLLSKTYPAGTTTAETIKNPVLATLVKEKRIYLIVSNTVSSLGFTDKLPLTIRLQNAVLHATVSKSLASAGGAVPLSGL